MNQAVFSSGLNKTNQLCLKTHKYNYTYVFVMII